MTRQFWYDEIVTVQARMLLSKFFRKSPGWRGIDSLTVSGASNRQDRMFRRHPDRKHTAGLDFHKFAFVGPCHCSHNRLYSARTYNFVASRKFCDWFVVSKQKFVRGKAERAA